MFNHEEACFWDFIQGLSNFSRLKVLIVNWRSEDRSGPLECPYNLTAYLSNGSSVVERSTAVRSYRQVFGSNPDRCFLLQQISAVRVQMP
jgi:hypothetical protein